MPDKKHKIFLVKNANPLFNKVRKNLNESKIAIEHEIRFISKSGCLGFLNESSVPPSIVICVNAKGYDTSHKEIFSEFKRKFPETRRMLVVEPDSREDAMQSVNDDEIHLCLVDPYKEKDLTAYIESSFKKVEKGSTWEFKKRIVDDKIARMYKAAKKGKDKDAEFEKIIEQKKKEYYRLKEALEEKEDDCKKADLLKAYILAHEPDLSAEGCKKSFIVLADIIAEAFTRIAKENAIELNTEVYTEVIGKEDKSSSDKTEDESIIDDLIEYAVGVARKNAPDKEADKWSVLQLEKEEDELLGIEEDEAQRLLKKLEEVFQVETDTEMLNARLGIKGKDSDLLTTANIFEYLRALDISYGLVDEQTLLTWLESKASVRKIIVAKGTYPEMPVDGKVKYHFDIDFVHAGKVKEDGSIDFRDRGVIPFVEENTLLAEKIPAIPGKEGVDVTGVQVPVVEPVDPLFVAGENTYESEDGTRIFAKAGGQPHLDVMGTVSVAPVLNIDGDVDFETGNVFFKGSIIVSGTVKEGFKVVGTNLTAGQIEGGIVNLTGDLNVSAGIIDSEIKTYGNIQAKYINNTNIETYGDMVVTTEILDSSIESSGKVDSRNVRIIGSEIVAKGGVEAGHIGTVGSKSVKLRVGVDDYILKLVRGVDKKITIAKDEISRAEKDIAALKKEDEKCFKSVSDLAYVQDRTQLAIKELESKLPEIKKAGDNAELKSIEDEIKKLEKKAGNAEQMVEKALDDQDKIADDIELKESGIEKLEEKIAGFENEKKAFRECSEKSNALAKVVVNGKVIAGTRIECKNTALTVRDDATRCKIEEIAMGSNGKAEHFEILITNL